MTSHTVATSTQGLLAPFNQQRTTNSQSHGSHPSPPCKERENHRSPNCTRSNVAGDQSHHRHFLSDEELSSFRTSVCENIRKNGFCSKQDACPHSHCLAWQRRDPYTTPYWPELCPNISFVKQGGKMRLVNNCSHRRRCKYAHSKEESLYHPLTYKMKRCLKPNCDRVFCPFLGPNEEPRCPEKVLYAPPSEGFAPSVSSQRSSPLAGAHSTPLKSPAPSYPVVPSPGLLSPALPPSASMSPPPGFAEHDRCLEETFVSVPLSILLPFLGQGKVSRQQGGGGSAHPCVADNLFFSADESSSRGSSPSEPEGAQERWNSVAKAFR